MRQLVIYVHGMGGSSAEAEHYKTLFVNSDIIGFDYQNDTPWAAIKEFSDFYDLRSKGYDSVVLIANSIGAFLSMYGMAGKNIDQAFFISPIVNMEKLITDMMRRSNVSEAELQSKKIISTAFNETLSWDYLSYVRNNPFVWTVPTHILYGKKDNLTSFDTMKKFVDEVGATLTVMEDGEHWFHTAEQLSFLDNWIKDNL